MLDRNPQKAKKGPQQIEMGYKKKASIVPISGQTRWPDLLSSEWMRQQLLQGCLRLQPPEESLAHRVLILLWLRGQRVLSGAICSWLQNCEKAKYHRAGSTRHNFCLLITKCAWWAFRALITSGRFTCASSLVHAWCHPWTWIKNLYSMHPMRWLKDF